MHLGRRRPGRGLPLKSHPWFPRLPSLPGKFLPGAIETLTQHPFPGESHLRQVLFYQKRSEQRLSYKHDRWQEEWWRELDFINLDELPNLSGLQLPHVKTKDTTGQFTEETAMNGQETRE